MNKGRVRFEVELGTRRLRELGAQTVDDLSTFDVEGVLAYYWRRSQFGATVRTPSGVAADSSLGDVIRAAPKGDLTLLRNALGNRALAEFDVDPPGARATRAKVDEIALRWTRLSRTQTLGLRAHRCANVRALARTPRPYARADARRRARKTRHARRHACVSAIRAPG